MLVRSLKNRIAPINQIPPEILSIVPDFWDVDDRDEDVIALTHVCQAWREVFVSCPTLWTNINGMEAPDKTRVYLERSKSSPIDLLLDSDVMTVSDPFFEFIPGATERLKSLVIDVGPQDLQLLGTYLSHPAPLLVVLTICSYYYPVLPSPLFNGDLSSLHELRLRHVRTELPWRNMVNLTWFKLDCGPHPVSIGQLLDFFESAPHLREVEVFSEAPIYGAQIGRLVPLPCLQRMDTKGHPSSHLFDCLLIPVGTRLAMGVDLPIPLVEGRPPQFIDNLRNLSNFTTIKLGQGSQGVKFDGPNGEVWIVPQVGTETCPVLESLAHFDTSKTERLEIAWARSPAADPLYRALLPMKDLRTLTFDRCVDPGVFIHALDPTVDSSGIIACPGLEELVIIHKWEFDIKDVVGMAAERASRGVKLKTVRVIRWDGTVYPQAGAMELEKHVSHVKFSREVHGAEGSSVDSGE